MQLPSRKNLIIISVVLVLLIGGGVWFFLFREVMLPAPKTDTPNISTEVVKETPDQIRVRQINLIKKSIEAAIGRGMKLPLPENTLVFTFGDKTLGYEGRIPLDFFDSIGLNILLDPVTQESYFYALSGDRSSFEIMANMDSPSLSNRLLGTGNYYSSNTDSLFTLDRDGKPIVLRKLDAGKLDIAQTEVRKRINLNPLKSCLDIYNSGNLSTKKSGVYQIDIDGTSTKVFCDMQTDGGGWTFFYANNGHPDSLIKKSYVEMREGLESVLIDDLSAYTDPNLAGLLRYRHFIDGGSKEILIRNRIGDEKKWVKFTFSTSRALEWALGPAVLGKTDYGCIKIPRLATWSIINDDGKIKYDNLIEMMNHGGTSWGVSHEKYLCNGYEKGEHPHIGFYSSFDSKDEFRARSDDGNGGKWAGENEYRYFIR